MIPLLENTDCLNCSKMNECLEFAYDIQDDIIPTEFKKIETETET